MIGSLMVGGHLDARSFDARDLRLFRTLATRTTAILENSRMERSIARLTELQEQLTHQAYHDSLTDLANRSLFGQQIDQALRRRAEGTASVAVIFLDIDDFKGVNDTLGHAAGDALLVEVAARIRGCLRRPDTAARLGGDEFALLIEGVDSAVEAEHVARRVLDVLRDPFTVSGTSVTVRASLGIAVADNSDANATSLMRHADVAMYVAKGRGRNRYVLFAPGMESEVVHRRKLRGELEHAMAQNQFILHYQPVVNLITGEITAVEALVRWHHPLRGIVAPGEFIGVAEESGLIMQLGEFVLRTACATTLQFQRVAVAAARRMRQRVGGAAERTDIRRGRARHRCGDGPPARHAHPRAHRVDVRRGHGDRHLEARGSAQRRASASPSTTSAPATRRLSYLRRLPVDILKIAKPFVDDLAGGEEEDFTRAIVTIADALQLHVIAEGIEAASQVTRLLSLGCLAGQGYHLCHPLPATEIDQLLRHGGIDRAASSPCPSLGELVPLRLLG